MPAISRVIAVTVLLTFVGIAPAGAWWRYAEWGLSEGQIMTASVGRAVPCRAHAVVCAPTSDGGSPGSSLNRWKWLECPRPCRSSSMPRGD